MMKGKPVLALLLVHMLLFAIGCSALENESNDMKEMNCLIDLHLHLDGSLSVASVKELAQLQGIDIPRDEEELRKLLSVGCGVQDLNEYLEKFDFPLKLLQTREAISLSVYNLCQELKTQGLIYAEIRFAPQLHCDKGLTQAAVIEAAIEGLHRSDLEAGLILCCMRGEGNEEANRETIRLAARYLGQGVVAADLAGAEGMYPTEDYRSVFALANQLGVPYTIHAGEADGPDSVRTALSFGARRIGHGVRSAEDQALVEQLAEAGVTLELCPTSNLHTRIFNDIKDHPFRSLMEKGVKVTVNTDNMTVSDTTLEKEWSQLIAAFSLTDDEIKNILLPSVDAAFAPEQIKEKLRKTIEAGFAKG